jgi:hypothetical protein
MIVAREKVEAVAKRGHAKCHGTGILGYRPGGEHGGDLHLRLSKPSPAGG